MPIPPLARGGWGAAKSSRFAARGASVLPAPASSGGGVILGWERWHPRWHAYPMPTGTSVLAPHPWRNHEESPASASEAGETVIFLVQCKHSNAYAHSKNVLGRGPNRTWPKSRPRSTGGATVFCLSVPCLLCTRYNKNGLPHAVQRRRFPKQKLLWKTVTKNEDSRKALLLFGR